MKSKASILNLTFCLILMVATFATQASESNFESVHLNAFYDKAVTVKTATLNGVEYCKLFHKEVSIAEESAVDLAAYNTVSLDQVSEEDIKKILIETEKKDPTFWEENKVVLDEKKISTLKEIISSNIFNNLSGVIDNIYCFPYLGSRFENNEKRKLVVKALSGIESKVKAFVYYDDGFYSKSASVLIVYLLDSEKNEVYALKGIIK